MSKDNNILLDFELAATNTAENDGDGALGRAAVPSHAASALHCKVTENPAADLRFGAAEGDDAFRHIYSRNPWWQTFSNTDDEREFCSFHYEHRVVSVVFTVLVLIVSVVAAVSRSNKQMDWMIGMIVAWGIWAVCLLCMLYLWIEKEVSLAKRMALAHEEGHQEAANPFQDQQQQQLLRPQERRRGAAGAWDALARATLHMPTEDLQANAQRWEYALLANCLANLCFSISLYIGKENCVKGATDPTIILDTCTGAIQFDGAFIVIFTSSVILLRIRLRYMTILLVVMNAIFFALRAFPEIPGVPPVVPEALGSFAVVSAAAMLLSIGLTYVGEKASRDEFELSIIRKRDTIELERLREQQRIVSEDIGLSLAASAAVNAQHAIFDWKEQIACVFAVHGFGPWCALRGPVDGMDVMARVFDVLDSTRMMFENGAPKKVDTVGDAYIVMEPIDATKTQDFTHTAENYFAFALMCVAECNLRLLPLMEANRLNQIGTPLYNSHIVPTQHVETKRRKQPSHLLLLRAAVETGQGGYHYSPHTMHKSGCGSVMDRARHALSLMRYTRPSASQNALPQGTFSVPMGHLSEEEERMLDHAAVISCCLAVGTRLGEYFQEEDQKLLQLEANQHRSAATTQHPAVPDAGSSQWMTSVTSLSAVAEPPEPLEHMAYISVKRTHHKWLLNALTSRRQQRILEHDVYIRRNPSCIPNVKLDWLHVLHMPSRGAHAITGGGPSQLRTSASNDGMSPSASGSRSEASAPTAKLSAATAHKSAGAGAAGGRPEGGPYKSKQRDGASDSHIFSTPLQSNAAVSDEFLQISDEDEAEGANRSDAAAAAAAAGADGTNNKLPEASGGAHRNEKSPKLHVSDFSMRNFRGWWPDLHFASVYTEQWYQRLARQPMQLLALIISFSGCTLASVAQLIVLILYDMNTLKTRTGSPMLWCILGCVVGAMGVIVAVTLRVARSRFAKIEVLLSAVDSETEHHEHSDDQGRRVDNATKRAREVLRHSFMILFYLHTAFYCGVVLTSAKGESVIGNGQLPWYYVLFGTSMSRPIWLGPKGMWLLDLCVSGVFLFIGFTFPYTTREFKFTHIFLFFAQIVCTFAIRWVIETVQRRSFVQEATVIEVRHHINEEYGLMKRACDSITPKFVGEDQVAQVRREQHAALCGVMLAIPTLDVQIAVIDFQCRPRPQQTVCSSSTNNNKGELPLMTSEAGGIPSSKQQQQQSSKPAVRRLTTKLLAQDLGSVVNAASKHVVETFNRVCLLKSSANRMVLCSGRSHSESHRGTDSKYESERAHALVRCCHEVLKVIEDMSRKLPRSEVLWKVYVCGGPLIGGVVGSGRITFDFYGSAMATAYAAVEALEWRQFVVHERMKLLWEFAEVQRKGNKLEQAFHAESIGNDAPTLEDPVSATQIEFAESTCLRVRGFPPLSGSQVLNKAQET